MADRGAPWAIEQQEPTTLFALWPRELAPERSEVLAALGAQTGGDVRVIGEERVDDPAVLWNVVAEVRGWEAPLVLWSEPARAHSAAPGLDDPEAQQCIWVIGAQSMLDPADPVRDLAFLLWLLTRALPEIPAILDLNATRWHRRADLSVLDGAEPPPETLWLIHAVADELTGETWLHTHGLWRCGRPELDLLGVPARLASAGGELLDTIGARLLEEDLPAPGIPFTVGPGLEVAFQPWESVVRFVGDAPGGIRDRVPEPGNPHTGVRAVVCAAGPRADSGTRPQWPATVLGRLDRGDAVLYIGGRETQRRANAARAGWPAFAEAFASVPDRLLRRDGRAPTRGDRPAVRFLIKAVIAPLPPEDLREHLWFVARRFDGERVEGELLNQPLERCGVDRGDSTWIERDAVSDWSVVTARGSFGPDELFAMRRVIEELAAEAGSAP